MTSRPTSHHLTQTLQYCKEADAREAERLIKQIRCIAQDACLWDLKHVAEVARSKGLLTLARIAEQEQHDNNGGQYYLALKSFFGIETAAPVRVEMLEPEPVVTL